MLATAYAVLLNDTPSSDFKDILRSLLGPDMDVAQQHDNSQIALMHACRCAGRTNCICLHHPSHTL